jgi:hypothetical protein
MLRLSFVAAALHRHLGWFNLIPNLSSRAPRTDFFFAPLFGAPFAQRGISLPLWLCPVLRILRVVLAAGLDR